MKSLFKFIPCLAALLLTAGCDQNKQAGTDDERPVIFASLAPVAGILERIVQEDVEVKVLVGEGQDPHDFAVEAGQLAALGKAKALFLSGMHFEEALEERLEGNKAGLKVIDLTGGHEEEGEEGEHEGEEEEHEEGEHDHNHSHAWLSPYDLTAMVEIAEEELKEMFPDKATSIGENSAALLMEIEAVNEVVEAKMKPFAERSFFTYHAAFDAFACAYDLEEHAVEVEGKTPTPTELAEFMKLARDEGARALLVQPQFDTKSAEAVAKELNLEVHSIDPMAKDALGNIRKIAELIEVSLSP